MVLHQAASDSEQRFLKVVVKAQILLLAKGLMGGTAFKGAVMLPRSCFILVASPPFCAPVKVTGTARDVQSAFVQQ